MKTILEVLRNINENYAAAIQALTTFFVGVVIGVFYKFYKERSTQKGDAASVVKPVFHNIFLERPKIQAVHQFRKSEGVSGYNHIGQNSRPDQWEKLIEIKKSLLGIRYEIKPRKKDDILNVLISRNGREKWKSIVFNKDPLIPLNSKTSKIFPWKKLLLILLALFVLLGGVGVGLAWRTDILDQWLPQNIIEILGRKKQLVEEPEKQSEQSPEDSEEPTEEPGAQPQEEEDEEEPALLEPKKSCPTLSNKYATVIKIKDSLGNQYNQSEHNNCLPGVYNQFWKYKRGQTVTFTISSHNKTANPVSYLFVGTGFPWAWQTSNKLTITLDESFNVEQGHLRVFIKNSDNWFRAPDYDDMIQVYFTIVE